jgi:hypothetical protein
MNNTLTEFRKRYAGEAPTETRLTAKAAAEIQAAYEAAYNHAFRVLALAKRKDNYPLKANDGSILEEIQAIFTELKGQMTNALKLGIWEAVKLATGTAQNDQLLMGLAKPEAKSIFGPPDKRYISTVYKDAFNHIAARTDHMTQTVKEALRRDVVDVMRRASIEGLTRKQAYKALREQTLTRDPDFAFFDRSGRRWAAQDYFDMLTKTTMANALRESYIDQLIADGQDLTKVSMHGTRCKLCRPWEGKALSLTGSTEGYPTLAQAKAAGLFHPRCRHRLVAYTPANDEAA